MVLIFTSQPTRISQAETRLEGLFWLSIGDSSRLNPPCIIRHARLCKSLAIGRLIKLTLIFYSHQSHFFYTDTWKTVKMKAVVWFFALCPSMCTAAVAPPFELEVRGWHCGKTCIRQGDCPISLSAFVGCIRMRHQGCKLGCYSDVAVFLSPRE